MKFNFNTSIIIFRERYVPDIRFWILLFFIVRLYGITNAPLEVTHNWRQVTGDMIARNFLERDNNILYPRIDMAGDKTGITGTEFPVLNYLMYLVSLVVGFHDWFGRIIVLIISSAGILYFYKLLKLKFNERISFIASLLLLTSNWFIYSRKVMPDTFSVSLVIIGLYYVFSFIIDNKSFRLLAYFLFCGIGILSKIPAAFLLITLSFILFDKEVTIKQKMLISFVTALIMMPVCWWYFYWVPYLNEHFGYCENYLGTTFTNGFHQILSNKVETLDKFSYQALKYAGFLVFLFGGFMAAINKNKKIVFLLVLCSFSFFIFMMKAGYFFYHHSYYVIPYVPVMCLTAAYGISQIKKQYIQTFLLFFIIVESIIDQQYDFRIKDSEVYKLTLEDIADKVSDKNDLVAINGGANPQEIYFLHRNGWTIETEQAANNVYMEKLKQKGCRYLFIDKEKGNIDMTAKYLKVIYTDADFIVYSLLK